MLLRSARRAQRWPQPRLQPPKFAAAVARARRTNAAASVASFSSSNNASRYVTDGAVGNVTRKFGDPSFWEWQYSSQIPFFRVDNRPPFHCGDYCLLSQYDSEEEHAPFEWFLPYEGGLREYLLPVLESTPSCTRVLHVGCGTSDVGPKLSQELSLSLHVTDTDISPSAVQLMKQRHAGLKNYVCREADCSGLNFPDGSFDAVVDKGTLDALLCRGVDDAREMVAEVHRVLTKGGVYVQVTAEDPDARLELITEGGGGGSGGGSEGKGHQGGEQRGLWSRHFFKELDELGDGGQSTYFLYVLVK